MSLEKCLALVMGRRWPTALLSVLFIAALDRTDPVAHDRRKR